MRKQFFLLAIMIPGAVCLSPISNNSARACDKNAFTCIVKAAAPVNSISDTGEEDFYSSSIMVYPLNHF